MLQMNFNRKTAYNIIEHITIIQAHLWWKTENQVKKGPHLCIRHAVGCWNLDISVINKTRYFYDTDFGQLLFPATIPWEIQAFNYNSSVFVSFQEINRSFPKNVLHTFWIIKLHETNKHQYLRPTKPYRSLQLCYMHVMENYPITNPHNFNRLLIMWELFNARHWEFKQVVELKQTYIDPVDKFGRSHEFID